MQYLTILHLDIDALKLVADGVNALRTKRAEHADYNPLSRLLDYIEPDHVHVLADGKIQRSGGKEMALELEANGYLEFTGRVDYEYS